MSITERHSARSAHLNSLMELHKDLAETARKLSQAGGNALLLERRRYNDHICSVTKSIDAIADTYARAWNLDFANNVVRRLPQELKNMIYLELFGPDKSRVNDYGEEIRRADRYQQNVPLTFRDYSHFYQTTYMGTEFVTELSKHFHYTIGFALKHPGELEGFLLHDRFGTCVPAEWVRYISIDLALGSFNHATGYCRDWVSPKYDSPLKQHFEQALRGLEALHQLVKMQARGVEHTLCLRVDRRVTDHGRKFAEVLGPLIYDLKGQGWKVKIEGRYATGQSHEQQTASHFDYSLSRAEWTKKTRENSAFAMDDPEGATKARYRGR